MRPSAWLDSRDSTKGSSAVNQPRNKVCSSRSGRSKRLELDLRARFDMMSRGVIRAMGQKQVHLLVRGRVQGVSFRASTQHEARRLGVFGWVKNCPDGSVEILAEGTENALADLVRWAHQGPTFARVDHVDVRWRDFEGLVTDFRIVD
jgi:acylphosphatase